MVNEWDENARPLQVRVHNLEEGLERLKAAEHPLVRLVRALAWTVALLVAAVIIGSSLAVQQGQISRLSAEISNLKQQLTTPQGLRR